MSEHLIKQTMADNIVIDTNCLVMMVSARNKYHAIWQSFLDGEFNMCVSNEILEEYAEVLARNINIDVARFVVFTIMERKNVKLIVPYYKWQLITADPDDNKFVDCAISANARFLVTEDKHFQVLHQVQFPVVDVIGIDDYLQIISS